jgi:GNAT superfamily N-acetyltransferase
VDGDTRDESTSGVVIRDARGSDIPAMLGLLRVLFAIEADFAFDAGRQERGLRRLLDGCGTHRGVLVADVAGDVVGMGSIQMLVSTAEGAAAAVVEDLVVAQAWRRRGVGRRLLARLEHWALERDIGRLQLLADRTNVEALKFYDRLGWQPTRLVALRRHLAR